MAKLVPSVESTVNRLWHKFQGELPKLGGELRPKKASEVFTYAEDDIGAHVTAKPVCLSLKERGGASTCQLFVAVEGVITFDPTSTRDALRTSDFKTRVGYFREVDPTRLLHVYGVHYDRDDKPAHPVFHSQMGSMRELANVVNANYHRAFTPVADADDLVERLLPNVRIPTAFMDMFSILLQVAGDHLIHKDSSASLRGSFDSLRGAVGTFRSSMTASPGLSAIIEQECFRAGHWYP